MRFRAHYFLYMKNKDARHSVCVLVNDIIPPSCVNNSYFFLYSNRLIRIIKTCLLHISKVKNINDNTIVEWAVFIKEQRENQGQHTTYVIVHVTNMKLRIELWQNVHCVGGNDEHNNGLHERVMRRNNVELFRRASQKQQIII